MDRTAHETEALRVEVSVDLQNAAVGEALTLAYSRRESALGTLHRMGGSEYRYSSRGKKIGWVTSDADAVAKVREMLASGTVNRWEVRNAEDALARLDAIDEELVAIREVESELSDIFVAWGRWNRFFLVNGGHIHSSTACHSCRPTTLFAWLPELSGLTEKEAVAEYGSILCSFCFPSAPVEWTTSKHGEKPASDYCPGSGELPVSGTYRPSYTSGYGKCRECGTSQNVPSSGRIRKHKTPKGK
jgi:hypothetical protein